MLPIILTSLTMFVAQAANTNTLTSVGFGPVPDYEPSRGTMESWKLTSNCVAINEKGHAACQSYAIGPIYGCGFRNIKKCGSKEVLVHLWDGTKLVRYSDADAVYDVPLNMNDLDHIVGYAYKTAVYAAGNGRIWYGNNEVATRQSVVNSINNRGDYIVETAQSSGGIVYYGATAYDHADNIIPIAGVYAKPFHISDNGHMIAAQILQNFATDVLGDEVNEVSGVGWVLDQDEIDAIGLDEKGRLDVDGQFLYPAGYIRPTFAEGYMTDYRTYVHDVNKLGEITIHHVFGQYHGSRLCSPFGSSVVSNVYGVKQVVPWKCYSTNFVSKGGKVMEKINDYGDAVGFKQGSPYIWLRKNHNKLLEYSIDQVVPANSEFEVTAVSDINNKRQISATCVDKTSGVQTGCILSLNAHKVPASIKKPYVEFVSPRGNKFTFTSATTSLDIEVDAIDRDGSILFVNFKLDNVLIKRIRKKPYKITLDTRNMAPGKHVLKAIAKDNSKKYGSRKIILEVTQPPSTTTTTMPPTTPAPATFSPSSSAASSVPSSSAAPGAVTYFPGTDVEGEDVITEVGTDFIILTSFGHVYFGTQTTIKYNGGQSSFQPGQNIQFKATAQSNGMLLASKIEVD